MRGIFCQLKSEDVLLIDIHVHSTYTPDCTIRLEELVEAVSSAGLDGFCLTDINTTAGYIEAKELASKASLTALVGLEAMTDIGHILVFVPNPQEIGAIEDWVATGEKGLISYADLLRVVEINQGVLVAAHPYDRSVEPCFGDGLIQMPGISALEVVNARRDRLVNELAEEVAAGVGLPGVGGSDARTSLKDVGRVASLVHGQVENEGDLIRCIKSCDIWPVQIGDVPAERKRSRSNRSSEGGRSHSQKRQSSDKRRGHDKRRPNRNRPRRQGDKPQSTN